MVQKVPMATRRIRSIAKQRGHNRKELYQQLASKVPFRPLFRHLQSRGKSRTVVEPGSILYLSPNCPAEGVRLESHLYGLP